jgi:hypothetical protein
MAIQTFDATTRKKVNAIDAASHYEAVILADGGGAGNTVGVEAATGGGDNDANPFRALYMTATERRWNGAGWDRVRSVNVSKWVASAAVASGASVTVWVPAAGKRFRLRGLVVAVTNAGRYEVRDDTGIILFSLLLGANSSFALTLQANGIRSNAANNLLLFYNQSGAAADVYVTAWGNEE